jgi:hypothetical protein
MLHHEFKIGFVICAILASGGAAVAQQAPAAQQIPARDDNTLNFDLWCQEQARLPAARCDKRTQEDESSFETHLKTLDHYELPSRSTQYDQGRVNRDIMNADPIDNPSKENLGGQRQYPDIQPSKPSSSAGSSPQ